MPFASQPFYFAVVVASAIAALTIAVSVALTGTATDSSRLESRRALILPPGAVRIFPSEYNVLGADYARWRTNNSFVGFNPTDATPPLIQVFDPSFLDVTGPDATIRLVSSQPGYAFAHEAPIYVPDLDVVFFCSMAGGSLGYSGWYNNSVVFMLNMTHVDGALTTTVGEVNIRAQALDLPDTVQMVNGGTGPYKGNLLFIAEGRAHLPPSIVLVNPRPPHNATVVLDNFYGRQFNSLNDIRVLPGTDIMFFTDPAYGWLLGFRPEPKLPFQVYRFDPSTGQVRVVADQFVQPNGIAFSADGKSAFIADSGLLGEVGLQLKETNPATIYQFDVHPITHTFINRRVFAYVDSGIPDGIQLDTKGNVYAGCGDGVHVWNSVGTLVGKFFIGGVSPQMIFTKSGLLILSEDKIYLTNVVARGIDLATY